MNQLIFEIKNHHITNEIVKLFRKYFFNFKKIIERLQLIVFKRRKEMSRSIRAIIVYILNNFKCAYSKIYYNLSMSIRNHFRTVDLMINDMKLIKKSLNECIYE